MKEIIEDLIKISVDVSKLTEKELISLADKLARSKKLTREQAKKVIAVGIKHAAKAQRVLAEKLAKQATSAIERVSKVKHKRFGR